MMSQGTDRANGWIYTLCLVLALVLLSLVFGIRREWIPPFLQPDSWTYQYYDENIFLGQTDELRTPGYPAFIKLTQCFASKENGLMAIVIGQIVLFEVSVVLFYLAVRELIRSGVLAFSCAAIYGVRYETCLWCFHIMSECLSLFCVILFFYMMVVYIKRPAVWKAVAIGLGSFLMVMARPVFVYVIALLLLFWMLRLCLCRESRRSAGWGMAVTLVAVALTLGYCELNERNHGFFGLSSVGYVNELEQVIITKLYERGPNEEMNEKIRDFLRDPAEAEAGAHPLLIQNLIKEYSHAGLKAYTGQTLRENRGVFIGDVMRRVKEMASDRYFAVLYTLFFVELAVILALWIGFRSVPWLHWGVWGMVYGMLFVVFWGSFAEYIRLMTPVLGLVLVMVFRYFDMAWQFFRLPREAFAAYLKEGL